MPSLYLPSHRDPCPGTKCCRRHNEPLWTAMISSGPQSVSGSLRLPGDKSISHRYAMLGAVAEGRTRIDNYSTGADCASTLGCLRALGVSIEHRADVVDDRWSRPGRHAGAGGAA